MPTITAEYSLYSEWDVPDYFLKPKENTDEAFASAKAGAWCIKWDRLFYFNKEGKEVELPPDREAEESHDYKRPEKVHFDESSHEDLPFSQSERDFAEREILAIEEEARLEEETRNLSLDKPSEGGEETT